MVLKAMPRGRANARLMTGSASSGDAGRRAPHHEEDQAPNRRFARRANLPQSASLISPPNQRHIPPRPVPKEGRLAIVTDAGRDAVDASSAADERAHLADGEVVWS
jgi:hypothetical protein